jgi:hypothetical protein
VAEKSLMLASLYAFSTVSGIPSVAANIAAVLGEE